MDKIDSQSVKYSVSASDHTTYLDIPGMTGISGPAESKNPSVFCSVCVILHIRQVMDRLHSAAPDGYCGDEDNGQTSAWYVFSALGFYPVCPASDTYAIGSSVLPSDADQSGERQGYPDPGGELRGWLRRLLQGR